MYTDKQLHRINNAIVHKPVIWWQLEQSQMGHDFDELFLQFADGSVVKIAAEHRAIGAALRVEPNSQLPTDSPVRNITTEVEEIPAS